MALDLSAIPLIDNHCHGLYRDQDFAGPLAWRRLFTESYDPGMPREHVGSMVYYLRLMRALAQFLGCEPNEEAVLAARRAYGRDRLIGDLLHAANIEALIVDQGFPPRERLLPDAEVGRLG